MSKEKDISLVIERAYPCVIALFMSVAAVVAIINNIKIMDNIDSILNAVLSFTSILLGFVGVLFALLFSLENNPIVKYILRDEHYKGLIKKYFSSSISSGFLTILITLILFFRTTLNSIITVHILDIIKVAWVFFVVVFTLRSYRIIHIIIKTAFLPHKENVIEDESVITNDMQRYEIEQMNKRIEI